MTTTSGPQPSATRPPAPQGAAPRARRRSASRELRRRTSTAPARYVAERIVRTAGLGGRRAYDSLAAALPRVPVRDLATLRAHHRGLEGEELADALVRTATLTVGAVAVAGSAVALSQRRVPAWLVAVPVTLVAELAAIAAIEAKLVAELHEVYGVPLRPGHRSRSAAAVAEWASRRDLDPTDPRSLKTFVGIAMSTGTGGRRAGAAPRRARVGTALLGGVAGATAYRRSLTELADEVRRDLRRSPRRRLDRVAWPPW